MALSKPSNRIQQTIMDTLGNHNEMRISDLVDEISVSHVYLRQQVALLVEAGLVERVDDRQPYIYRKKQLNIEELQKVQRIKKALMAKDAEEFNRIENVPLKPFVENFRKLSKDKWLAVFKAFELIEQAVIELDEENELIETL